MSVYATRRKDAAAKFIQDARTLRVMTMRIVKRFPTSYRWMITNSILELAGEIYTHCLKGNAVYLHKDIRPGDFDLRRRYFMAAYSETDALIGEITFCYELVEYGNNFFKSSDEVSKKFSAWMEQAVSVSRQLKALLNSDMERFKGFKKK